MLIVLDSVGIGGASNAAEYGDDGANTLGHIFERLPGLRLPSLCSLGLAEFLEIDQERPPYAGSYGRMKERSAGKDTTPAIGRSRE